MVKLHFLGTAASTFSKRRNPTSFVLETGSFTLLIECGDGCVRRLIDNGYSTGDIDAIFISHGHDDHLSGITSFLWQCWLMDRRDRPLVLIAPGYVQERIDALIELFSTPADAFSFEIKRMETGPGVRLVLDSDDGGPGLLASFGKGVHDPPSHAIRVDVSRGDADGFISICYSGDTAPSEELVGLAEGVDCLVHEATFLDEDESTALKYNHCTPGLAARVARSAGAKRLVLIHYSNSLEGKEDILRQQALKTFDGPVTVAMDGDVLHITS